MTVFNCSNCNKVLIAGDKERCENNNLTECAECEFHALTKTRTITAYNAWLRKG